MPTQRDQPRADFPLDKSLRRLFCSSRDGIQFRLHSLVPMSAAESRFFTSSLGFHRRLLLRSVTYVWKTTVNPVALISWLFRRQSNEMRSLAPLLILLASVIVSVQSRSFRQHTPHSAEDLWSKSFAPWRGSVPNMIAKPPSEQPVKKKEHESKPVRPKRKFPYSPEDMWSKSFRPSSYNVAS